MEDLFCKLPQPFLKRMEKQMSKEEFELYKTAINDKAVRGIRINKNRVNISDFLSSTKLKLKKLDFCDDGFILDSDEKLGNSPEHLSGIYYLQEPSSMLAVCASEIEKEKRPLKVLDLCAAPGGKTSQIATRISKDSILFANEIIKSRAQILFSNIERQGFDNVVVLNEDPKRLMDFEGCFDYVFVDAPCSGEGMFRKNPETISEWNENIVLMSADRQREILEVATKLVAENGKLVYSTCTYSVEEDEKMVEWLSRVKNFELLPVSNEIMNATVSSKANLQNKEHARKVYSLSKKGEGQFIAVFKNNNNVEQKTFAKRKKYETVNKVGKSDFSYIKEFFEKSMNFDLENNLLKVGESVFLPPKAFSEKEQIILDSIKFMSIGIKLGTIEKGRFEPHHNLFMALDKNFKTKIELSDENLSKFLHGEEVMADITPQNKSVYVVLTKNGMPIGGGKLVGNRIKNLYPKGMRI